MTYEMYVENVANRMKNANVAAFGEGEHLAYQVNITGEGEGAFYIELKDGSVYVQPYEYYDRDVIFCTPGDVFLQILNGTTTTEEAIRSQLIACYGDEEKALKFDLLKPQLSDQPELKAAEVSEAVEEAAAMVEEVKPEPKKRAKKASQKKTVEEEKTEEVKATAKKATSKKQTKKK